MDKAYDSDAIRQLLEDQGAEVVIPGKPNCTQEICMIKNNTSEARKWSGLSTSSSNSDA
jgi:hypothetical protein